MLHKGAQKRIYMDDTIYYVVGKTHDNYPYFKEPIFCDLFIEHLKLCRQIKGFELYAFSIIYDHINLLFKPGKAFNYSQIMKSIKENVSRDINVVMGYTHNSKGVMTSEIALTPEGTTSTSFLRAGDAAPRPQPVHVDVIPFQQRYLNKFGYNDMPFPKFRWQKSFYDHYIRGDDDFENHYRYTAYNHLKHGLLKDWKYTSLNYPDMIDC